MVQPLPTWTLPARTATRGPVEMSAVGFGCGPRAGLMVCGTEQMQAAAVEAAVAAGITYFDTAELYGDGESETSLARALRAAGSPEVTISSKVRLTDPSQGAAEVREHVLRSLDRLGRDHLDSLSLHNRIVADVSRHRPVHAPGPAITTQELLRPGGPWEAMLALRDEGVVGALGLTGPYSDVASLAQVMDAGTVDLVTVEYNLITLGAGARWAQTAGARLSGALGSGALGSGDWSDDDRQWAGIARAARASGTSLLALRALGGGALVRPPSDSGTNPVAIEFHRLCAAHDCPPDRAAWWFAVATGPGPVLGGFRSAADAVAAATGARGEGVADELRAALLALADAAF
jgi:aryl-alcohol dehydrogenase-like predicted oxidoreductase